ncbi:hypothetical protein [Streptomyces sp. NBC_01451]|uniref:hypothetical protein n=1 Tax=Streptomyces sp. NBC_01451 TaxID=2903872 RepID=UPI002E37AD79|nr:hypothetical protein [Streptomyces sp. NBC_01451]
MSTTIDALLADARLPTTRHEGFDVGAALRRLAADAATASPTPNPDMIRAAEAGQRLSVVCRWILNRPDAADHVDRLAQEPDEVTADQLDVDGALIFACLLHLTDHRESAQFWWQLAAGAGHRAAAYCLHLHHLALGETREARHWLHEVTHDVLDSEAPDSDFLATLEAVAMYVRRTGSSLTSPPTGGLEMEVDRLATEKSGSCIIVRRPDQQLADRLHDFTRR